MKGLKALLQELRNIGSCDTVRPPKNGDGIVQLLENGMLKASIKIAKGGVEIATSERVPFIKLSKRTTMHYIVEKIRRVCLNATSPTPDEDWVEDMLENETPPSDEAIAALIAEGGYDE